MPEQRDQERKQREEGEECFVREVPRIGEEMVVADLLAGSLEQVHQPEPVGHRDFGPVAGLFRFL